MADVDVLVEGYARLEGEVARVAGTVSLVRAPGLTAVVDPGMVADREDILRPLRELGAAPEDITTVVETSSGTVAVTHLWWDTAAESDRRATDLDLLHAGRARVLAVADRIVPGHGPAFDVTADTPR